MPERVRHRSGGAPQPLLTVALTVRGVWRLRNAATRCGTREGELAPEVGLVRHSLEFLKRNCILRPSCQDKSARTPSPPISAPAPPFPSHLPSHFPPHSTPSGPHPRKERTSQCLESGTTGMPAPGHLPSPREVAPSRTTTTLSQTQENELSSAWRCSEEDAAGGFGDIQGRGL
jgi:hypothetical protein